MKHNFLPGHALVLQFSIEIDSALHSFPPLAALIFTSLVLVLSPPPHVFEHSPISHSAHLQWTKANTNT